MMTCAVYVLHPAIGTAQLACFPDFLSAFGIAAAVRGLFGCPVWIAPAVYTPLPGHAMTERCR